MKAIGYYNPFPYPVSFCGSRGNMIEVSPNAPVTGRDGKLVGTSEVLDQQVSDGTLKRIYDNHPQFKDFDKKVERRAKATRHTAGELKDLPLSQVKALVPAAAGKGSVKTGPESTMDSRVGLVEGKGPVVGKPSADLPPGAEVLENGSVSYQNKTFASPTALRAYLKSANKQPA